MSNVNLPEKWPTYVCKASWAGTSIKYLIPAPNAESAKDRAWKQIARTEGGDTCLKVDVIEERT